MKRNSVIAFLIALVLVLSVGVIAVSAAKPPRTALDVMITSPDDGLVVESGGSFDVSSIVTALKGDAGLVATYVQYAVGEDSTAFIDLGGSDTSVLHIISGDQPQSQSLLKDQFYTVSWTLTGPAGTYEIRIRSEGELAKSDASTSVTVRILPAPLPEGMIVASSEEMDPTIGYGVAIGSFESTYSADGMYEILSEGKNAWETKKPTDDTTELGWIFTFDLPTPRTPATFYFYGYAEFPDGDSDTAFLIQEESGTTWNTILEINYAGFNKLCSTTLSDETSAVIRLRIIDNDRTVGNKEISSLHIDQAFIGVDGYQSPTSGIEILTMPYTCHRFQAWENFGNDWYHDADIAISGAAATDIEIVDLDLDGRNEFVVAELISETYGVGVVEIFDLDYGTSPIQTLPVPVELSNAVMSLAVGNFDDDDDLEIVGGTAGYGGAVFWDVVDGLYQVALILKDATNLDLVAAGNLDGDEELEVVFANGWDLVLCEVIVYDYDSTVGTWVNTANYSSFILPEDGYMWFTALEINDINGDGLGEIYVMGKDNPFHILTYTGSALVDFWTAPDVVIYADVGFSFVIGDLTNDGNLDLVFYTPFLPVSPGFLVFEYDAINGFTNTYNFSNPGMVNIFGEQMAIGDVDGDLMNELVVSGGPGGVFSEGKLYIFRYDTLIFMADLNANESNCVVIGDYDNDA
ncbi:MAG: VCBS repeat-containing protein [Candidatus Thorarchaeota archaeon]|nr:VCBS repeat-containing protein [Candidatus Thorarchaeota archaeon]